LPRVLEQAHHHGEELDRRLVREDPLDALARVARRGRRRLPAASQEGWLLRRRGRGEVRRRRCRGRRGLALVWALVWRRSLAGLTTRRRERGRPRRAQLGRRRYAPAEHQLVFTRPGGSVVSHV